MSVSRFNRRLHALRDWLVNILTLYRKCIEAVYSQCEAMGLQRLHARTNTGFDLKVWASLLDLAFTNILN
ncbi:MAG: hypothetical protein ACOYL5_09595 [Phototrophicaceae bacterium]